MQINKLEPVKIFLSYFNEKNLKLAKNIGKFYGVKVIDSGDFINKLLNHKEFQ